MYPSWSFLENEGGVAHVDRGRLLEVRRRDEGGRG